MKRSYIQNIKNITDMCFILENYDTGPIIDQAKVPVFENDTPETLAERVLAKEHEFFVEVLKRMEEK